MRERVWGFTIDGEGTTDPDDALGVQFLDKGCLLTVSIADITGRIPVGGPEEVVAREKRFTRYQLPGGTDYMIPAHLATDELCLVKGQDRNVLAMEIYFDADRIMRSHRIFPAVLWSDARLTYQDCNEILRDPEHILHSQMRELAMISYSLYLERKSRRGEESDFWDGSADFLQRRHLVAAEVAGARIVEEAAIIYNTLIAQFAYFEGIDWVFRSHRGGKKQRSQLAYYSTEPEGHYGQGRLVYCHASSTLRRLPDFVNQHNWAAAHAGRSLPYPRKELEPSPYRARL